MIARAPFVLAATMAGTVAVFTYQPPDISAPEPGIGAAAAAAQDAVAAAPVEVVGPPVDTDYGPVAVTALVDAATGRVVQARATTYPTELPKSARINRKAVPTLEAASVGRSSADGIATVSGATYTSEGFRGSLAAALASARTGSTP